MTSSITIRFVPNIPNKKDLPTVSDGEVQNHVAGYYPATTPILLSIRMTKTMANSAVVSMIPNAMR
jgi:hypothetical protein